jgi:hypothetical protein
MLLPDLVTTIKAGAGSTTGEAMAAVDDRAVVVVIIGTRGTRSQIGSGVAAGDCAADAGATVEGEATVVVVANRRWHSRCSDRRNRHIEWCRGVDRHSRSRGAGIIQRQ